MKRILITGGCGFMGHHFVDYVLKNTDWDVVIIDKLTYASHGLDRLRDIAALDNKRVLVLGCDFSQSLSEGVRHEVGEVDYIVHMGAETHVDRSIENPEPFVMSNVVGTMHMLNFARSLPHLTWFVYFSTDEIFGPAEEGVSYKEWDRYNSANPYSATKAGGEELALSYANTYKLPLFITHTMNIFGDRQYREKFIPKVIKSLLAREKVTIHADPTKTQAGRRSWIHAQNVSSALLFLLAHAKQREKYNIAGEREVDNLSMAQSIARVVGKPLEYELVDFHSSRPGHDLRYALDGSKLATLGWHMPMTFEESLKHTIQWTLDNQKWI
ncbi:MAG: GDP-mannose 4,6-dehydratase [Candidatus Sungbacteria bacterium]|nr:GDP-mannose 4,6-dehydratase [Candidatus Sungbacteria bacterium]